MTEDGKGCRRDELLAHLKGTGAVAFGEFTLASGKKSDFYVNIKKAYTDPKGLGLITGCLRSRLEDTGGSFDALAGVELGAVPLLVALAMETGKPFIIVRKNPKGHGMGELFIGDVPGGGRVVLVEDVVTTAGSVVKAARALREAGAVVDDVLVVVDRREGSGESLGEAGLRAHPVFTSDEVRS